MEKLYRLRLNLVIKGQQMKNDQYTFKIIQISFKLKSRITCDSPNLIYIVISDKFTEEYTGKAGEGKTKLRDRVRVFR